MTEHESQYRRWTELMDRKAVGETLTPDELTFCERLAVEHPACAREVELLEELADVHATPNAESGALVDATLARMAQEAQRVESSEVSQLKVGSRVPRLVWMLGAAAAMALGLAFVFAPRKPPAEIVQQPVVQTRVELVYTAGEILVDGKAASGGSALLSEGSTLTVTRGSACLAMDPGIDLCLNEGGSLVLSRIHSPWRRLDLFSGKVGVQLEPQPDGSHFSIVAGDVWSTAVGTAFTVERNQDSGVRTSVMNGKVRVGSDGGREQLVSAHQRADVHDGTTAVSAMGRNEESPEWALLRPSELWQNPVSATLELRGLPPGVEVLLDGQSIGSTPLSTLCPAGAHVLQLLVDGRIAVTRELTAQVGQTTTLTFDATDILPSPSEDVTVVGSTRSRAPSSVAPDAARASAAELLSEARRLMRGGRFDAAAAQYEALRAAYPESAESHTVLVSLAELQLDRLGQPDRALVNLERYLIGGGALAEEARHMRIRALRVLHQRDGEIEAIREFLATHSGSFRTATLARRLSDLGVSD